MYPREGRRRPVSRLRTCRGRSREAVAAELGEDVGCGPFRLLIRRRSGRGSAPFAGERRPEAVRRLRSPTAGVGHEKVYEPSPLGDPDDFAGLNLRWVQARMLAKLSHSDPGHPAPGQAARLGAPAPAGGGRRARVPGRAATGPPRSAAGRGGDWWPRPAPRSSARGRGAQRRSAGHRHGPSEAP